MLFFSFYFCCFCLIECVRMLHSYINNGQLNANKHTCSVRVNLFYGWFEHKCECVCVLECVYVRFYFFLFSFNFFLSFWQFKFDRNAPIGINFSMDFQIVCNFNNEFMRKKQSFQLNTKTNWNKINRKIKLSKIFVKSGSLNVFIFMWIERIHF